MIYLISSRTSNLHKTYDIYYVQEKKVYICFPKAWFQTTIMYDISNGVFYTTHKTFDRTHKPKVIVMSPIYFEYINIIMLENLLLNKIFNNSGL